MPAINQGVGTGVGVGVRHHRGLHRQWRSAVSTYASITWRPANHSICSFRPTFGPPPAALNLNRISGRIGIQISSHMTTTDGWRLGAKESILISFRLPCVAGSLVHLCRFHGVHVAQQSSNGHIADGLLEEQRLDGGRPDGAQRGEQEQQPAEAGCLARVAQSHMVGEDALRLILQHLHRLHVAQAGGFGCEQGDGLHAAHLAAVGCDLAEAAQDLLDRLHLRLCGLVLQHPFADER